MGILLLGGWLRPAGAAAQATDELPAPAGAFAFSLATTAAPVAAGAWIGDRAGLGLIGAGLLFGPLSGYAYGDVMGRGRRGLGFRAAVAGGTVAGVFLLCQLGECNPFSDNNEDQSLAAGALVVSLVGTAVVGGSALIDVLSVPDYVARRNETRRAGLAVVPMLGPTGAGLVARIRL